MLIESPKGARVNTYICLIFSFKYFLAFSPSWNFGQLANWELSERFQGRSGPLVCPCQAGILAPGRWHGWDSARARPDISVHTHACTKIPPEISPCSLSHHAGMWHVCQGSFNGTGTLEQTGLRASLPQKKLSDSRQLRLLTCEETGQGTQCVSLNTLLSSLQDLSQLYNVVPCPFIMSHKSLSGTEYLPSDSTSGTSVWRVLCFFWGLQTRGTQGQEPVYVAIGLGEQGRRCSNNLPSCRWEAKIPFIKETTTLL